MNRRLFLNFAAGIGTGLALRRDVAGHSIWFRSRGTGPRGQGRLASLGRSPSLSVRLQQPSPRAARGGAARGHDPNPLYQPYARSDQPAFPRAPRPPTGSADNSFLMVAPGEQFQYELPLPAHHPGGTFWIHPHVHGAVARQVWRGLAAPIIVRGELDAIPEIQAAAEVVLVLQDVTLDAGGVPVEPNLMEQVTGREGNVITASGRVNPTIAIQKDGWVRLRLVNASCSRFYRLKLEQHTLYQIASEGGALPAPVGLDELLLVPGQRAELMIQGSREPGTYRLLNLP